MCCQIFHQIQLRCWDWRLQATRRWHSWLLDITKSVTLLPMHRHLRRFNWKNRFQMSFWIGNCRLVKGALNLDTECYRSHSRFLVQIVALRSSWSDITSTVSSPSPWSMLVCLQLLSRSNNVCYVNKNCWIVLRGVWGANLSVSLRCVWKRRCKSQHCLSHTRGEWATNPGLGCVRCFQNWQTATIRKRDQLCWYGSQS